MSKEEGSSVAKKSSFGFSKKKEKVNVVVQERRTRPPNRRPQNQQVAVVTPVVATTPTTILYNKESQQGQVLKRELFDPIPMTYVELYPTLIQRHLVQPRAPVAVLNPLPWYYKANQTCAYHQRAPGHNIENCYPLKLEVQKMVRSFVFQRHGS